MSIEKLSTIWPEWQAVAQLGEGSFGKVYKVTREEHGVVSTAAVKIISIPQSDAELSSIRSEGLDETGTRSYFAGIVADFVNEIKLMQSMKGTSNVVSVEDYKVLEKTDGIGWDIFIRMELLTPLNDYIADRTLTEAEVIKLGQDVCTALELCAQQNIIHRDIKPENIFVSAHGDFKVGDFGIAREMEKTSGSLSQKGTYNYMAPEVTVSKHYDATVDIYSLGLVLYKLLNNNRLPFLDPHAQQIQYQDRKYAIDRRFSGEALPAPINASPHLAQVILTACAFNPAERFQMPTAFKNALGAVIGEQPSPIPTRPPVDPNATMDAPRPPGAQHGYDQTASHDWAPQPQPPTSIPTFGDPKPKKSKKPLVVALCLLLLLGAGAVIVLFNPGGILGDNAILGNIFGDPNDDIIAALENEDFDEALLLAEDAGDTLQDRLSERLDVLLAGFMDESVEYSVAIMELDAIEQMGFTGLTAKINRTRDKVNTINASRIAFNTAQAMFDRGDYIGAMDQYRLVVLDDPNFDAAEEGLSRAIAAYRGQVAAEVDSYISDGDYVDAIRVLNNALRIVEDDPELTQSLIDVTQRYVSAAVTEANALASRGEYHDATALIDATLRTVPDDDRLIRARSDIQDRYVTSIIAESDTLVGRGEYREAIALINEALRTVPGDERLTGAQTDIREGYVSAVIDEAEALLAQHEHDEASALVNDALQLFPGDEQLLAMRAEIAATRPVSIRDITSIADGLHNSDVSMDNFQNVYLDVVTFNNFSGTFQALLDSRYTRLRGTVFVAYGTTATREQTLRFELDGRTIESHTFDRATRPVEIDIDLLDGNDFRIITTNSSWNSFFLYFADFRLYP